MEDYIRAVIDFFVHPDPQNGTDLLLLAVIYTTLAGYLVLVIRATWRLFKLTLFENISAAFAKPFAAPNPTGDKRILILGDSTAVGAGASTPAESIAGRLAHDFPHADIVNLGINGARTKDVLRSMTAVTGQKFELVIVSVGGNDIYRFTSLKKLENDLRLLVKAAKAIAVGPVILLLYNNIGSAPILPGIMRRPLKRRGDLVQELFRFVAAQEDVSCIELFSNEEDNPFLDNPHQFYAPDGIHPSSEGYRLWYHRMWRLLVAHGVSF